MAKTRHKKRTPTSIRLHRKRVLSRKPKTRKIKIVAREGQPEPIANIRRLRRQDVGGAVASSWISALAWDNKRRIALMALIDGKLYDVPIPFKMFEAWNAALSKGTFFNRIIRRSKYYSKIKKVFG